MSENKASNQTHNALDHSLIKPIWLQKDSRFTQVKHLTSRYIVLWTESSIIWPFGAPSNLNYPMDVGSEKNPGLEVRPSLTRNSQALKLTWFAFQNYNKTVCVSLELMACQAEKIIILNWKQEIPKPYTNDRKKDKGRKEKSSTLSWF